MSFDPKATTVVVFSHPNHELAIFGFLQALRPWLVYLTDGGGEHRVEQTREGLRSIGLLDRARFLNHTEQSFYDALLDRDGTFYTSVAAEVADAIEEIGPAQVLCDAVEFYNPVHDMSLPIVRAALQRFPETDVYEIPLVYQRPAASESYQIQRPVAPRSGEQVAFPLSDEQLEIKLRARDEVYTILTAQLPIVSEVPVAELATEVIVPAPTAVPEPDATRVLRYERRAQLLLDQGEIERMITYSGHFVPVVTSLAARSTASH